LTTPVIKPFKTISIPNYVPEFTSEVKGKVIVGIHSATGLPPLVPATTDKPSATIAIPDYVPEFTSNFDEQFLVGNHSPSGLPTPVPATIIDPSGGISVVPTNGPIVSFDPDGHVSVIGTAGVGASVTASAESNNAAPMTFSPTLVTLSKGPTISVDATGGVSGISASALSEGKHKTKTHHTTKTHQATKMHKTHYHHTKNPVSISVIPGLHTSFPGLPAPKPVTSVDSTGGVHIITGSQGTASTLTDPTGGVNVVATSSVRCGVPMPNQSFTTTLVIPMPQPTVSFIKFTRP
jgi:hypothetical protein